MFKGNMQWQRAVCVTGAIFILLLGCPFLVLGRRDISCDFDDDDCGYTNTGSDTFGWTRIRKNSTSADQHMFAGTFLPTTILTSSVFSFSQQATACLQFRYRIHGNDSNTIIGVFSVDDDTSSSFTSDREEVFLYRGPGGDSSEWVKTSREMSSDEPFRLQIEVNGYSEVDVDDITVLPHGACSGGISCSFDTDWCGYSSSGPELSLSSSNLSAVTGPLSDHMGGSSSFVAFRPDPSVDGFSATLRSPSEINFSTFPWCLEFWYHVFGTDVGSLKVKDSNDSIVWSRSISNDRNWHLAQVDMETNTPVTFRFEAESGGNTIVAIDDIYADSKACQLRQAANCDFESDLCGYTVSGDSEDVERRVDELENVALGKPVLRSPEWPSTEQMERIVDGEYGTHGPDHCVTSRAPNASGKHWVRIDLLDSYKVEKVVIHTRGDCCGENFQDVSVFVSNTYVYDEVSSVDLCREFRSRASLGQVVTVPCIDGVKTGNYVWLQRQDSAPLSVCDVDVMARTAHYLGREATPPENATAVLESPVLTGRPSKLCLRFAYHLKEEGIGTLKVYTQTMGGERTSVLEASSYTAGLALAEVDLDFTEPIKVVFEAVAYLNSTRNVTAANVALDSVSVDWNTCQPVNLTSNWTFSCDRPTTPCARGADCEDGVCQCLDDDDDGLQCQIPAASRSCPGPVQLDCGSGQCYTKEDSYAGCYCDDGYYGQNCQHEMVHAECDDTTMVVNIYPYGYDVTKTASNQPVPPDAEDGECHFLTAEVFEMANPLYIQKNWDGYVRAFLHTDPNCGNVTIVEDSDTETTYSRTFNVYYNYLGRDPTDTKVTVNCTVEKEMTTTTTTQATTTTEMQTTTTTTPMPTTTPTTHRPTPPLPAPYVTGVVTHAGRRWLSRYPPVTEDTLQVDLSLNVPNFAKMTAIRVLRCMVSTGSRSTVFVSNGCAVPPIGQLVMTGPMARTQVMLIRMMRRDFRRRMRLSFVCTVRLCHARTNFSCFKMRSCFGRKKRSAEVQSDHAKGDNQVDVTFDFSE